MLCVSSYLCCVYHGEFYLKELIMVLKKYYKKLNGTGKEWLQESTITERLVNTG